MAGRETGGTNVLFIVNRYVVVELSTTVPLYLFYINLNEYYNIQNLKKSLRNYPADCD